MGSKLHSVWRYADLGWHVLDERYVNIDVEGLSWAPVAGQVVADYFPEFEMRLAHSVHLPDELLDFTLLPSYPNSGLISAPLPFDYNIRVDPESPQKVVHHRSKGYVVSPADLYIGASGTPLLPYPMNRGAGDTTTYTWRDTAVLARGGPNGTGIPLGIEERVGVVDEAGVYAGPGDVPSIGLPLLMEFRCFPADTAIGLNALGVQLAINSSARPNFRSYSSGGFDMAGNAIVKHPDLEQFPTGGFSQGQPTMPAENTWYVGEADFVVRVSRVHSVWFDTELTAPGFVAAVVEAQAPPGTEVKVEFRTAHGFDPAGSVEPFDAALLDAYGDPATAVPLHAGVGPAWTDDLTALDPARYIQARITLVGDIDALTTPVLDTLGIAFTNE